MIDRCPNGWFGSHKFEPRYDLGAADLSPFFTGRVDTFKADAVSIEKMRTKTYVHDICIRCGKTIERGSR